jgi:hypothetical protein
MSTTEWHDQQRQILDTIYPAISDRIHLLKQQMIKSIDKSRRIIKSSIPSGTTVMLIDQLRRDKFEPKYIGPFTVVRRARNGAYVLRDTTGDILDRHVPIDQLKIIKRSVRQSSSSRETFEVDQVINHRGEPGSYEYLVRWKNYTADDDTWEPEANFLDTQCIRKYWNPPSSSLTSVNPD